MVADESEPHAFLLKRVQLTLEIEAHQRRKVGDFLGAASPVLRGESIEGQDLDTVISRRLECSPDGFGASAMSGHAWQSALLRPAAVSIHDDGDVTRNSVTAFKTGRAPGRGRCRGH